MVMHIRLETVQERSDGESVARFRELWEANDCRGLPPPVRSLPIKVWALLREGPLTVGEVAERLGCAVRSVYVCVQRLRDEGQVLVNERSGRGPGRYELRDGPALRVVENRDGIRLLRAGARRCVGEVVIELR